LTRESALKAITFIVLKETSNSYQSARGVSAPNKQLIALNGLQVLLPSLYELLGKSQRSVQLSTLYLIWEKAFETNTTVKAASNVFFILFNFGFLQT
jgi:hypothetical protein